MSRNLPVQLFISICCSIESEKLANRGIVRLSSGKGGGLPGNTEAPLPTHLMYLGLVDPKGKRACNLICVHLPNLYVG